MTTQHSSPLKLVACLGCSLLIASWLFLGTGTWGMGQGAIEKPGTNEPGLIKQVEHLTRVVDHLQEQVLPPVGAIVAWHRDIRPGHPLDLPSGWIECDGRVIPEGPLKGLTSPSLNKREGSYNGGRFLRGGEKSGDLQEATALFTHWEGPGGAVVPSNNDNFALDIDGARQRLGGWDQVSIHASKDQHIKFICVRPTNMSVIFIMRIL
jgi:hypothetical protein